MNTVIGVLKGMAIFMAIFIGVVILLPPILHIIVVVFQLLFH